MMASSNPCSSSAPARRIRRPSRCRWSRGWKRSTPRTIETSNGRSVVQYRGQLMPLVPVNADVRIKSEGAQPLLVFADQGRSMALVVDEIVDIVEERLDIELASTTAGILGSAVIKGQATEIIDVSHFLPLAFEDWLHWRHHPARCCSAAGPAGGRRTLLPQHAHAGAESRGLCRTSGVVGRRCAGDVAGEAQVRRGRH